MLVSGMFTDMKGFEIKLEIFMKQFREENFMYLPTYNELLMNEEKILSSALIEICNEAIKLLKEEFGKRFQDFHGHKSEIQMCSEPFQCITRGSSGNLPNANN